MSFEVDFSHEISPSPLNRLDDGAKRALAGTALAHNTADDIDAATLYEEVVLRDEVRDWAEAQFNMETGIGTLDSWSKYQSHLSAKVPETLDELMEVHYDLPATLHRLYDAKGAIAKTKLRGAEGFPLHRDMILVMIPWLDFYDKFTHMTSAQAGLSRVDEWFNGMTQGHLPDGWTGFMNLFSTDSLPWQNVPVYRDDSRGNKVVTPLAYLEGKLRQDGPWGIMLMHDTSEPGILDKNRKKTFDCAPDKLPLDANGHFSINGVAVDKLGFFEWYALVLQTFAEGFREFHGDTWLLANEPPEMWWLHSKQRLHSSMDGQGVSLQNRSLEVHHGDIDYRLAVS